MRGCFYLDEPSGERWELALELMEKGKTVAVANVGLSLHEPSWLDVLIPSSWHGRSNITEESAREDLVRGRGVLDRLMEDKRFSALVEDRAIHLELILDEEIGSQIVATIDGGELVRAPNG